MKKQINSATTSYFVAVLAAFLLSGCVGTGKTRIVTEPQGAQVIADGKRIGTTPMEIVPDDLHMRVPLYIGSREDVMWIETMLSKGASSI